MPKIKILHVFEYFAQGGIENFVMNVFRNIDRKKFQFDFAFINRTSGVFDDEAKALGGNIYYFNSEEKSLKNYKKSLTRIIKENGPYDVVHSHMYYFSGYILKIAKKCGVKVRIAHSHETLKGREPTFLRKMYENYMRKLILKNATNLLACSDMAGKFVFGDKASYQVLYNGIDLNRFAFEYEKRVEYRKKLAVEDKFVLLNVGRFADQKNHKYLIKIFEEVTRKIENAFLILIGDGPLQNEVEAQIDECNLTSKVKILSNIKNTEDYYNSADVFLLPSKYEGMGIVAIEAQATGLYTLISDCVTKEVAVTDIVEYLSITDLPLLWAEKIECIKKYEIDRIKYYSLLNDSKFNIEKTVLDLCKVYTKNYV
ncbi:MAG: glycosyltransferase family 1 protein [Lachnospiraceae bacterium]|nr:glycosyltransferase family 1 protein [Lachnospiraceae bacterium]